MITQSRLKILFNYKQGKLYWVNSCRGTAAGSEAGTNDGRYTKIMIDYKLYLAHRLIWLYHYGYLPEFIDHKYGRDIGDYLWNLRECTRSQNGYNAKLRKDNKSGVKGVYFHKSTGKWFSQIRDKGKRICVGYFKTVESARVAMEIKRNELHGEFSNHG